MRADEHMAIQAAVEGEEYEQIAEAQQEWEAQMYGAAKQRRPPDDEWD